MPKQTNQAIIYFSIIIIAIASIFWVNGLILAWSPPSASPPNSNVAAPINTSGTAQTKSGSLYVQGSELGVNGELYVCGSSGCTHFAYDNGGGTNYLRGPTYFNSVLYDENNPGYYVDPASTSRLNYGIYDNLYSYGWMQSPIFYDSNNTGYYVDPASTSKFNTINLGGVSRSSWPTGDKTYSYGNYLVHANNTLVYMNQTPARVLIKESIMGKAGNFRIKFTGFGDCCWVSYAIYRNGSQVGASHGIDGSWHSHSTPSGTTWAISVTEDIPGWNAGDRIQLYGHGAYHQGSDQFELYADSCDGVACSIK